jgi:hypothetical protein
VTNNQQAEAKPSKDQVKDVMNEEQTNTKGKNQAQTERRTTGRPTRRGTKGTRREKGIGAGASDPLKTFALITTNYIPWPKMWRR